MTEKENLSLWDISLTFIDGRDTTMRMYKGNLLLVVNTAGDCKFSYQYESLEKLFKRYNKKRFFVLAFPSDDFGKEPDDNETIQKKLIQKKITYPVFSKTSVKGALKHPLFLWLTDRTIQPELGGKVSWNFNKFLISPKGRLVARFISSDEPLSKNFIETIESFLPEESL